MKSEFIFANYNTTNSTNITNKNKINTITQQV